MSNASWGTKRSCPKCAARFYDLNQHPATCPKCSTSFDPVAMLKPRRGRSRKFSNLASEADADESVLTNIMAKASASKKASVADLDDDKEDLVEDAEEIEDFESLSEIGAIETGEESGDDPSEETIMEEYGIEGGELVDTIEDGSEDAEEEESDDAPRHRPRR